MGKAIFATIFKKLNSVKKSKDTNICLDPLRGLNPGGDFDNLKPRNLENIVTESCNGGCLELLGTETANGKGIDILVHMLHFNADILSTFVGMKTAREKIQSYLFKVCKYVHHHTIQINHQPDATISPVYYLDVYLQLNMFRASSRPSSGAQQLM